MKSVLLSTYRALIKHASTFDANVAHRAMLCASPIHSYDHLKREWVSFDSAQEWDENRRSVDVLIRALNDSKEWYHPSHRKGTLKSFIREKFRSSPFSTQNLNFAFAAVKTLNHTKTASSSLVDCSPSPTDPIWNASNFSLIDTVPMLGIHETSNHFIVAHPLLSGFFRHSIVLMLKHESSGALGVIVNKPLSNNNGELIPLWSVVPDQHPLFSKHLANHPVMLGGPVGVESGDMMLIFHNCGDVTGARCIGEGPNGKVFLNGELDSMVEMLEKGICKKEDFICFLGYSSWGEEQLSGEIERGSWFCVAHGPCRSEDLLQHLNRSHQVGSSVVPSKAWCNLLHSLGGEFVELTKLRALQSKPLEP
jgi:putative transcriptional regulator